MSKNIYYSKKGLILGLMLWIIILAGAFNSSYHVFRYRSQQDLIIVILIWIPTILLIASIWFGTRYIFKKESLIIKIGFITHSRLKLATIRKVKRSRSMFAAPANSLDRLQIEYGRMESVLVSPKHEADFVRELQNRCPKAEFDL